MDSKRTEKKKKKIGPWSEVENHSCFVSLLPIFGFLRSITVCVDTITGLLLEESSDNRDDLGVEATKGHLIETVNYNDDSRSFLRYEGK